VPQISDASKGLTFRTRPMPANYTLLTNSPLTKSDQYGDTRNTTWGSENGRAPAFTNAYARTLLERDYVSGFRRVLDVKCPGCVACVAAVWCPHAMSSTQFSCW
jgi:hypothetical protein